MASLQELSAELLHLICEYCTSNCFQNLRLTSRTLHAVATDYYLPEVVTCLEAEDLRTVRSIAGSSQIIRHGVKSLVVQADGYDAQLAGEPLKFPEWLRLRAVFLDDFYGRAKRLLRHLRKKPTTSRRAKVCRALKFFLSKSFALFSVQATARRYYMQYRISAHDQSGMLDEARMTIDNIFAACPNLSSLAINFKDTLRQNAGLQNERSLRCLNILHGGCPAFVELIIIHFLTAASHAGLTIRDLALSGAEPFFISRIHRQLKGAPHVAKYYNLLQHVHKLHLVFNGCDFNPEDLGANTDMDFFYITDDFAGKCLVKWLENFPHLRELRLVMPVPRNEFERVELNDMIRLVHLPNLVLLHLANFRCSAQDMEFCLLQFQETLQVLELSDVHLASGTWPECFSTFAGKFAHLRAVKLAAPFTRTADWDEEDVDYYLGFEDQSPKQVRERLATIENYILSGCGPAPIWDPQDLDFELESDDSDGAESDIFDANRRRDFLLRPRRMKFPDLDGPKSEAWDSDEEDSNDDDLNDDIGYRRYLPKATDEEVAAWRKMYAQTQAEVGALLEAGEEA